MEAYSENQVQKLKNNLSVTFLIKNTVRLLGDKNEINNKNKNKLEKIQKDKKLYALKFAPKYENIKKLYELAMDNFKGQNEVSVSSYGLSIISDNLIIYITKQIEESLK
jgi:enoyl-[acyl-carrier-protein] reductase (NADH)